MGLTEYRRKRDFRKTSEPRGKKTARRRELSFVIQKHDASHLHYDFRLELDGVLKSWAVPKGPDLDPANKRLAMQVEDHPLEYGDFEGTIPKGEYGGGTVMLWDRGTWEPVGDAAEGLRHGALKFALNGERLQGRWMLVRKGGAKEPEERHWFLFKERDEFADTSGRPVTEEYPLSVTTDRDLDAIANASDRVWGPQGEIPQKGQRRKGAATKPAKQTARSKTTSKPRKTTTARIQSALKRFLEHPAVRKAALPRKPKVQLATLADEPPQGEEWLHEIKYDGYRMLCRLEDGKVKFISRNGNNWTDDFPELADAARTLPVETSLLDGEVVALLPDGTTSFQSLQNIFQEGRTRDLVYYVFDILHVNGFDVTDVPLETRKDATKALVSALPGDSFRYSDHLEGTGMAIFAEACKIHLEGIVSKRRDAAYRPGRGPTWLKIKCAQRAEFVIGGYTPPTGKRTHLGALLLGYYDDKQRLIYVGRVGTGFSSETLENLSHSLGKLVQRSSPFDNLSGTTGQARNVTWVKPQLVAEIQFSNWTDEGILRHPSFLGLRGDKQARDVHRDLPVSGRAVETSETSARKKPKRATSARPAAERQIAGVRLSHPDKVLYPDDGITKADLAEYYTQVAKWMLPHVVDRPLSLYRCPDGVGKGCFFQKQPGQGVSELLHLVNVSENKTPEFNLSIDDLSGLITLVQMGTLEIHAWGSKAKTLEKPDRLTFDLDPDPTVEWPRVVSAAKEIRALLEEFGLTTFLKTTGGKGLHLVVPVRPHLQWDEAKEFCQTAADVIVRAAPTHYTATMSKAARKGKIFVDYFRNGRGSTAIAPYSTRARPGATVSVPIAWEELTPHLHSDHFTTLNLPARLKVLKNDPWKSIGQTKQSITAAMRKTLKSLLSRR